MKEIITQPQKGRMAGDLVFQILDAEGNVKREQREHNLLKEAWYRGGFFHAIGYGTRIATSGAQAPPSPFNYLHLIADDNESSSASLLSKGTQLGYAAIGEAYSGTSATRGTVNLIESDLDASTSLITGKGKLKYIFDFPGPCANGTVTKVGFSTTSTFNQPSYRPNSYGTYMLPGKINSAVKAYKIGEYLLVYKSSYTWMVFDSTGTMKYEVEMGTRLIHSNEVAAGTLTKVQSHRGGSSTYVYTLDLTTGEVTQSDTTYNLSNISNIFQLKDGSWMCSYYSNTQPWYTFDIETMSKVDALDYDASVGYSANNYELFSLDIGGQRHYFLWYVNYSYSGSVTYYFIHEDALKNGGKWSTISEKIVMTSPMVINDLVVYLHRSSYSDSNHWTGLWYPFLSTECVLSEPITKEEGETLRVVYEISYDI